MRFRVNRSSPGQILVLMAIAMAVLAAFAALAIDVGNLWTTKRLMQTAADAAAIAGADAITQGAATGSSTIASAAQSAATQNGF
ncbi:MAG TPA: pilus assembly protein TadG-related protein, partial [Candidatus Binataceae bacterium]|nr:pilus assembly protein TadG-related protein [Candidatus Binataceae bacterium]